MDTQIELVKQWVLGQYLSAWPDAMRADSVIESLADETSDEIIVWEPYENWDEIELAQHISETCDSILNLFNKVKGTI